MKYLLSFALILSFVCTHAQNTIEPQEISPQDSLRAAAIEDSLEKAFMNGEYYFSTFIRLKLKGNAFIFVEPEYFDSVATDSNIKKLFDSTEFVFPNNREAYYAQIISALPKNDLKIHEMVWALPEVILQGRGGDGGLYTLATWIVGKPTADDPYYHIEVRRNYYWRFGICMPISYIKIHEKKRTVFVIDTNDSWEYLPLKDWRALQKKRQKED